MESISRGIGLQYDCSCAQKADGEATRVYKLEVVEATMNEISLEFMTRQLCHKQNNSVKRKGIGAIAE